MAASHKDFWRSSGFGLLKRNEGGWLEVTDDYLRAYFLRPEIAPVEESCAEERALHERLMQAPRLEVPDAVLGRLADEDAVDNYRVLLAFRDELLRHDTLEAAYVSIFRDDGPQVPVLFMDQLVHVILRGILENCSNALEIRAAELFFRSQKVTLQDGAILVADEEIVNMHAADGGFGSIGRLLAESNTPMRSVELDVLSSENCDLYWQRDERFDTVLEVGFGRPGLHALCRVVEAWVAHFTMAAVSVQPLQSITDEHWSWHIGLDAEANGLLNDLYKGTDPGEERLSRLLALFRMDFKDSSHLSSDVAGHPIYMGMAKTPSGVLRLKPHNLLANLPMARPT